MQKLADISVFENIQANANQQLGFTSNGQITQMSVFNEPIDMFNGNDRQERLQELRGRVDELVKRAPGLYKKMMEWQSEHNEIDESMEHLLKQAEGDEELNDAYEEMSDRLRAAHQTYMSIGSRYF